MFSQITCYLHLQYSLSFTSAIQPTCIQFVASFCHWPKRTRQNSLRSMPMLISLVRRRADKLVWSPRKVQRKHGELRIWVEKTGNQQNVSWTSGSMISTTTCGWLSILVSWHSPEAITKLISRRSSRTMVQHHFAPGHHILQAYNGPSQASGTSSHGI